MLTQANVSISTSRQRRLRIVASILLFLLAAGALAAGYSFISDPSGKGIGIHVSYLQYAPFNDFLIPGIILFTVNGVFSLVTALATVAAVRPYPLLIQLQGLLLSGWIVVQVLLVRDFNLLHFTCLVIGVALLYIGTLLKQSLNSSPARPR